VIDDLYDVDSNQFGYFLNLVIVQNLNTELERNIDSLRVDRLNKAESLRKQQQSQRVLDI